LLVGAGEGASFNCFEAVNAASALRLLATSDVVAVPSGNLATRGGSQGQREEGTGALDFVGRIFLPHRLSSLVLDPLEPGK
jgi:hypothetical protein